MATPHLEILRAERVVVSDGERVEVRPAAVWIEAAVGLLDDGETFQATDHAGGCSR